MRVFINGNMYVLPYESFIEVLTSPFQLEESKLHIPKEELAMLKPKASTSKLPTSSGKDVSLNGTSAEGETQAPASGVDATSGLPAATRSTSATKPNTIEQKLVRAHASKKRKMKEPNPLSVKKKKPNMTSASKKKAPSNSTSKSSSKGEEGGEEKKNESKKSADPTKGITRPQGDGTSKKALKRKMKNAQKAEKENTTGAPASAAMQVDTEA